MVQVERKAKSVEPWSGYLMDLGMVLPRLTHSREGSEKEYRNWRHLHALFFGDPKGDEARQYRIFSEGHSHLKATSEPVDAGMISHLSDVIGHSIDKIDKVRALLDVPGEKYLPLHDTFNVSFGAVLDGENNVTGVYRFSKPKTYAAYVDPILGKLEVYGNGLLEGEQMGNTFYHMLRLLDKRLVGRYGDGSGFKNISDLERVLSHR